MIVKAEDFFKRRVCITLTETQIGMLDNLVYADKRINSRASRSTVIARLIDSAVPQVPAELEL
ncbi:hypothetical protein [Bifidobacterium olomucense]|uniref:Ribbon-helix-helix protein CopG domain-containing protein n=1 Tax=Bifidobacterium olomucense TaxID=2675324 RepID=A0A7Y0F064_9BIFI|nr:hypothetical protein [Bifidobacterium sp. DSM 109959]NMM99373.1 hypothetical protein [Bifidobacterium sp. DSM 109959]